MGLDMYLNKRIYVWSNDRKDLKISGLKIPVRGERVKYIVEEAGYWRKANAIHKWFVENVQDGEDDCGDYYVSEDDMKNLLATVKKVLKASKLIKAKIQNGSRSYKDEKTGKWISDEPIMENGFIIKDPKVAKELLPTEEGFFFGGTEYNNYYIDDLKLTKKILEEALKDKNGEFEYHSSW